MTPAIATPAAFAEAIAKLVAPLSLELAAITWKVTPDKGSVVTIRLTSGNRAALAVHRRPDGMTGPPPENTADPDIIDAYMAAGWWIDADGQWRPPAPALPADQLPLWASGPDDG